MTVAKRPIRLVLCDDHRIVTEGLINLLANNSDVECVGTAHSAAEALVQLEHLNADVLLTDLDMPEVDGFQLAERAKAKQPDLKVVILSMHDEPALVKRAMDLGADGFLVKTAGREEVLLAVREAVAGRKHFSAGVMEAFLRNDTRTLKGMELLRGLTEREVEVLAALAEGLGNKEIGDRMGVSPRTVDSHRTNLMRKLDVHNVAGLVRIAIKAGLVQ